MLAHTIRSVRRQLHNLADKSTWENFYASKQNGGSKFDWFVDYQHLKKYLEPWITSNHHHHLAVLDLGCGISDIGARIFLDL